MQSSNFYSFNKCKSLFIALIVSSFLETYLSFFSILSLRNILAFSAFDNNSNSSIGSTLFNKNKALLKASTAPISCIKVSACLLNCCSNLALTFLISFKKYSENL